MRGRDGERGAVPNHLWLAVVAAVLWPLFGIVALVYSARVNTKAAAGDYRGAEESSRMARVWARTTIGFVLAFLLLAGTMWVLTLLF